MPPIRSDMIFNAIVQPKLQALPGKATHAPARQATRSEQRAMRNRSLAPFSPQPACLRASPTAHLPASLCIKEHALHALSPITGPTPHLRSPLPSRDSRDTIACLPPSLSTVTRASATTILSGHSAEVKRGAPSGTLYEDGLPETTVKNLVALPASASSRASAVASKINRGCATRKTNLGARQRGRNARGGRQGLELWRLEVPGPILRGDILCQTNSIPPMSWRKSVDQAPARS